MHVHDRRPDHLTPGIIQERDLQRCPNVQVQEHRGVGVLADVPFLHDWPHYVLTDAGLFVRRRMTWACNQLAADEPFWTPAATLKS
jgi:hypothetical protein